MDKLKMEAQKLKDLLSKKAEALKVVRELNKEIKECEVCLSLLSEEEEERYIKF